MAWITKPSATTKVEKRDEPYLTEAMRTEIRDTIMPRYETTMACLLPTLHLVQHEYGWIPAAAMMEVAEILDVKPADVLDTVSFYEEYWTQPKGKRTVAVCRSIACEFCNHQAITDAVREKLNIEVGDTTDDDEFTLIELECLGSCGTAPVALLDDKLLENLTPDKMTAAIDEAIDSPDPHGSH